MPLDPVIAGGFRGLQLQDPLEQYSRISQIQQAQQQNQLAALKLQEYQRGVETANRLRSLDPTASNYMTEVMRLDPELGSQLMLRGKQQTAAERAAAASEAELRGKNLSFWQQLARDSARAPTDETLTGLARRAVELGIADQNTAVSQLQQLLAMPPEQRSQVLSQYGAAAAAPPAAPATPAEVATMRALGFPLTPQGYAQYRDSQRQERMLSPEEEAQRIRIALASKPPAPPAAPREPPAPTVTQIQDPADPNRMLTIDARRYAGGSVGAPGVIGTSGKTAPAAAAEQKKVAAQNELQNVIDTLKTAYADLDAMRAVPSEQRNVISNALSYIASTGPGQVAGRIGGTAAQTQRDVIQSSRNLLFTAVKNATGKTSGELNSNVEFKTWLEALTDPSRSIQANQAILENLEKFVASGGNYSAKRGGGEVKPAPGAQAPAGFPAPPQGAIDALKRGQGTDAQFDAIFGPGAAARARRQ